MCTVRCVSFYKPSLRALPAFPRGSHLPGGSSPLCQPIAAALAKLAFGRVNSRNAVTRGASWKCGGVGSTLPPGRLRFSAAGGGAESRGPRHRQVVDPASVLWRAHLHGTSQSQLCSFCYITRLILSTADSTPAGRGSSCHERSSKGAYGKAHSTCVVPRHKAECDLFT